MEMSQETALGQGQSQFPSTVWESLDRAAAGEKGKRELNELADRYWRPIYRFIRSVWKKPVEDAKDLTQEFFAVVFDRDFLRSADRTRGNFRQFVLASLRNFLTDRSRATNALRRGGDRIIFSMDLDPETDVADPASNVDAGEAFDQAWAAEILRRALGRIETEYSKSGRAIQFEVFRRHSLEGAQPSYRDIARDLGLGEFDVGNHLVAVRRDLRRICVELIGETVTDPLRVEEEMKFLFGTRM